MRRSLVHAVAVATLAVLAACGGSSPPPPDAAPPDAAETDAALPDGPMVDACVPALERCDGADNDCDAQIDEPWEPNLGETCRVGVGACAADGTVVCATDGLGTTCDAQPGTPASTDTCGNNIDEDCDGVADEGCACAPTQTRPCGVDIGACALGTQTCTADGQWGSCEGDIEPADEDCDDVDDDCDGPIDENLTTACDSGMPGTCAAGTSTCAAGAWGTCVPSATPTAESCNNVDDDCDTHTDETLVRSCGVDTGECVIGSETCGAGTWGACTGSTDPVPEACDGRDEDCDGVVDDGCPVAVTLRAPANGHATGSVHASATTAARKPLRPAFRWNVTTSATAYDIQVDDSCDRAAFAACTLPSPEWSARVATTTATPPTNLPVSTQAPVGRAYFWRVRGCNGNLCGPWSEVRYLLVGQLPDDLDGDGYSEIVVGAPRHDATAPDAGRVYIYRGGPGATFDATPDLVLDGGASSDNFGTAVAAVGDLDGDGFAELAVAAPLHDGGGRDAGRVMIFRGGATLDAAADVVLDGTAGDGFGRDLDGAGDADADGYGDLLVGAPFDDSDAARGGRAYLYRGRAALGTGALDRVALVTATAANALGWSVAAPGDVDADGIVDLLVGAPFDDSAGRDAGAVYLYRGMRSPPAQLAPVTSIAGTQANAAFGWSTAGAGDVNGDDRGDLLVGAHLHDLTLADSGVAFLFLGGALPLSPTPSAMLAGSRRLGDDFGWSIAGVGDVDGDGFDDVLVGEPYFDAVGSFNGRAYLFRGASGTTLDTQHDRLYLGAFNEQRGWAVARVSDANGDGRADLVMSASRNLHSQATSGHAFVYFGATNLDGDPVGRLEGENAFDRFGASVGGRS